MHMPPKRLLVFCDSTGQDGMIAPDGPTHDLTSLEIISTFYGGVAKSLSVRGGSDIQPITNVLRLAGGVKPHSSDHSKQQIVYYQSGVGLEANFIGNPPMEDRKLQAQGVAVANFEIGDEIFIFGDADVSKPFSGTWETPPGIVPNSEPLPKNALVGGVDTNGTLLYIGRATYKGGMHPGEYRNGEDMLHITCDGQEISVTGYELLTGKQSYVRWIRMTGRFAHDKLCGFHPVQGGKDANGEFLYIIQGFHEGSVHCGKTKLGAKGLIPYGGNEVVLDTYHVLVFDLDRHRFRNKVGRYLTSNAWWTVEPGNTDSSLIHISPHAPIIPRILVGLNKMDISQHETVRVRADADEITCTQFTTRIGTWSDCRLFNSGASWLKLAAADPDFQHGDVMCNGEQTTTIHFNWRFDKLPIVYVGIRGFEVSGDRRINVSASDVSRTGFNLNVDKWGNTRSLTCWVTWIAFSSDKKGVSCGTFGGTGDTDSGYSGSTLFTSPFQRAPMIFVAFTALDIDSDSQVRVDIRSPTEVTATGMNWEIETWAGSRIKKVRAAYLAIEPDD